MDNRKDNGNNLSQADRAKGGRESHKNDANKSSENRDRNMQDGRRER